LIASLSNEDLPPALVDENVKAEQLYNKLDYLRAQKFQ
jgi:hypothetical protein